MTGIVKQFNDDVGETYYAYVVRNRQRNFCVFVRNQEDFKAGLKDCECGNDIMSERDAKIARRYKAKKR